MQTIPNNVIGFTFDTRDFTYVPGEYAHFVAEASDFGPQGPKLFGRLYNDACDQGFVLHGTNNGTCIAMAWIDTEYDEEGDVKFWQFEGTSRKGAKVRARVYND